MVNRQPEIILATYVRHRKSIISICSPTRARRKRFDSTIALVLTRGDFIRRIIFGGDFRLFIVCDIRVRTVGVLGMHVL